MAKPGRPPQRRSRDEKEDGGVHLRPRRHTAPSVREMPIITRAEAEDRRWRHYYTGLRCKNGHLSVRRVDTGGCVECNRQAARLTKEKRRKARSENPPDLSDIW